MATGSDEHMVNQMICDSCGEEWTAVHPVCERLQCECGAWTQVPPITSEADVADE